MTNRTGEPHLFATIVSAGAESCTAAPAPDQRPERSSISDRSWKPEMAETGIGTGTPLASISPAADQPGVPASSSQASVKVRWAIVSGFQSYRAAHTEESGTRELTLGNRMAALRYLRSQHFFSCAVSSSTCLLNFITTSC